MGIEATEALDRSKHSEMENSEGHREEFLNVEDMYKSKDLDSPVATRHVEDLGAVCRTVSPYASKRIGEVLFMCFCSTDLKTIFPLWPSMSSVPLCSLLSMASLYGTRTEFP